MKLFLFVFFLLLSGLNTARCQTSVLLVNKVWGMYIRVAGDTAYYEVRHTIPPAHFSAVDTLVKGADGSFKGKHTLLKTSEGFRLIDSVNRKKAEIHLVIAGRKAIRKWHTYKNEYQCSAVVAEVLLLQQQLEAKGASELLDNLSRDWEKLCLLAATTDHNDFDREFKKFKDQYMRKSQAAE